MNCSTFETMVCAILKVLESSQQKESCYLKLWERSSLQVNFCLLIQLEFKLQPILVAPVGDQGYELIGGMAGAGHFSVLTKHLLLFWAYFKQLDSLGSSSAGETLYNIFPIERVGFTLTNSDSLLGFVCLWWMQWVLIRKGFGLRQLVHAALFVNCVQAITGHPNVNQRLQSRGWNRE